ncbi:Na+/H+ antiporter NhaC [Paenibacillus assamensis]|uniref:Na+/H+ antiporter NhaC n=1 Tax=Paenibacillus assamensis TaxID=311244 RepID=UPI0003F7950A|nr:Na+/H+ antiporter NhaC [Paenibacillus assamensis]
MNHNHTEQPHPSSLSWQQGAAIFILVLGWLLYAILGLQAQPHMPLLIAAIGTALALKLCGQSWKMIEQSAVRGMKDSIQPVMLLSLIGILIGAWMMSGTVPAMLVYGTNFFLPEWFALSAMLLTVVVSMSIGSSITTVATFGVAIIAISEAMGANSALVAGAVVSGACFGDKMSPLSDTTNFAAAVSRVSITSHIRNMTKTTIPAFLITIVAFSILGHSTANDMSSILAMKQELQQVFHIHLLNLLPLVVVLIASLKRIPILLTMLMGIGTALLITGFIQGNWNVSMWMQTMQSGLKINFELETLAPVINRGGIDSMMWSISLIGIAFVFGGLLQHGGVIRSWIEPLMARIKRKQTMVVTTGLSSIGVNFMTGEQYMSILIPGQMFQEQYEQRRIPRLTLSRTLEDCGTLINPLVPWGVSGAMMTSAIGMDVLTYAPFALFLWISPLCTFAFALIPGLNRRTLHETE